MGDEDGIYVVRANGEVLADGMGSRFFVRSNSTVIQPGDTIVVPLDTDYVRPITFWTTVTQILSDVAVTAASVKSILE